LGKKFPLVRRQTDKNPKCLVWERLGKEGRDREIGKLGKTKEKEKEV
jgi:hypothetical protein